MNDVFLAELVYSRVFLHGRNENGSTREFMVKKEPKEVEFEEE